MTSQTLPLASKPRFEILDGLRGVAAMIVVAFHLFETYSTGPTDQILNHGYLAVDFFFVLSGFVIGYAYDDRWGRMTIGGFFKRRLIRLQPMVILGTLNGAQWSLMWEYVANILYAVFVRRLGKIALGILVAFSALLTIDLALDLDVTGLLASRSYAR